MLTLLYLLMTLEVGCFTNEQIFETKTVHVGDDVNLSCPHRALGSLFWIRLGSENFPEVLRNTFSFQNVDHRVRVETEPGTFGLYINKANQSDAAVYYCIQVLKQNLKFLKATNLRVEDPVHSGDPVTLRCSVLADSENKTCPGDFTVSFFRAGSDDDGGVCKVRSKAHSAQTSVYNLSNNVTASVSGPFCCPCGEIFFGNGIKLNCEVNTWDYQMDYTILFWLCVALSVSLIPMAVLICCMMTCDCCNGPVVTEQQNQHLFNLQKDEDTRVHSTVIFTMEKLVVMDRRGQKQQR